MPQPSSEQALNGQQLQALQQKFAVELVNIKKDVDLRKWAVDQACGLAGAAMEHQPERPTVDAVKIAREIHAFLTEGASEPTGDGRGGSK